MTSGMALSSGITSNMLPITILGIHYHILLEDTKPRRLMIIVLADNLKATDNRDDTSISRKSTPAVQTKIFQIKGGYSISYWVWLPSKSCDTGDI